MKQELAKKLFKAMHKFESLKKDKSNPYFKSYYTDINTVLNDIKPILKSEGLFITQPIVNNEVCTMIVDGETGECFPDAGSGITIQSVKPQERGSEVTYYRRYGLMSLLGLEAEDDDGNAASKQKAFNAPITKPNTNTNTNFL